MRITESEAGKFLRDGQAWYFSNCCTEVTIFDHEDKHITVEPSYPQDFALIDWHDPYQKKKKRIV